jgi:hypothetical protein
MRPDRMSRAMVIVIAVGLAAASLASPAAADRWVRYKGWGGPRVVRTVAVAPAPVYWSSGSSGVPSFASFVGGIIVGTALAQVVQPHPVVVAAPPACPVPPPPPCDYYYYDPWCHVRFASLEAYDEHLRFERHPAIVRVIDEHSGRCIGERAWHDGRWRDRGDWDDGDDR